MIAEEDIKVGAKVKFNYKDGYRRDLKALDGNEYWIVEDSEYDDDNYFTKHTVKLLAVQTIKECFTSIPSEQTPELELPLRKTVYDIARPVLAERKVGKVPMHMVVDGFPLALKEVAKVMGWAGEIKGYKLHDWRNLPDAEIEFPAAGYRHMFDNSEMKSQGLSALERVDHESALVHLAHECFNKLAELELVLSGKIK